MSGAGKALTNELLVREYTSAVYGLCLAYTRNIHDAEDAVQDVFLKAFAKLHTLKDSACIRSWLLKIARRTCIDKHRKGLATDAILQKACTSQVPPMMKSGVCIRLSLSCRNSIGRQYFSTTSMVEAVPTSLKASVSAKWP